MKATGTRCHPNLLRWPLTVDDNLAVILKGERQNAPGIFCIDIRVQIFKRIFDGKQYGINGSVELSIVHGGGISRGREPNHTGALPLLHLYQLSVFASGGRRDGRGTV